MVPTGSILTTNPVAAPSVPNLIPPVIPGLLSNLQVTNVPGKLSNLILAHVPLSIKNKVWSYMYINVGSLLDNYSNPDEEKQFNFFPDRVNQKISFKAPNKYAQITSFNAWNKAFHMLIELIAVKWPTLCLPMIQYMHIIHEQAGKFPFTQVYSYDKQFHTGRL